MEEMKEAMKQEKIEENASMDAILRKYGVDYTGIGPSDSGDDRDHLASVNPEEDDPLASLGFGFEAYWKMLSTLSIVFLIMTVLFIPQITFFYEGKGLEGLRNYNNA